MVKSRPQHWDEVYATKPADRVSWFQDEPTQSLALIAATGVAHGEEIIDVGGGASVLVDRLLDQGYTNLTVLDVSATGLAVAQARLTKRARCVTWLLQDVATWRPPRPSFRLWHDRAVFHFLVSDGEREGYLDALDRGLQAGGFLIMAPFAPSGPEQCSGLPVRRYSSAELEATLGSGYRLMEHMSQAHVTPAGNRQDFAWCLFQKVPH